MQVAVLSQKILRYARYYPPDFLRVFYWLTFLAFFCISKLRIPNDTEFVELVYKYFLWASLSGEELFFYKDNLEKGRFSRLQVLISFLMLPIGIEKKIFPRTGIEAHHLARLKLVQEMLPEAEYILDLGGAIPGIQEGVLRVMGYPYQPREITIVDLPPEARLDPHPSEACPQQVITQEGIKISYTYGSMTDLSKFTDNTMDLVWSGQSIEHVTEEEAQKVIQEVFRVLKPGGLFCLDTPNRKLTKLLVRTGFVHPEHKIEYTPEELVTKIKSEGFLIEKKLAVSPMPYSLRSQRFSRLELMNSLGLSENPDEGFSFFLSCRKPDNS